MTLSELDAVDKAGLAALWVELLGDTVPAKMSQSMQRRFLAFELQAQRRGGLPAALVARLTRLHQGEDRNLSPTLKPGARLLRAWNGTTHVVDVVPDGFLWNGTPHRSLSAIARAITGARWSGPRFFGLIDSAPQEALPKTGQTNPRGKQTRSSRSRPSKSKDTGAGHLPNLLSANTGEWI